MAWEHDHLAPVEALLFRSNLMKVGNFKCHFSHPCFRHTGPLDNDVFAFVRCPVWMRRGYGEYRFVEPGGIVMHRAGAEVERRRMTDQGEHAYWFGLHPSVFVEVLERHDLSTADMGDALVADPLLRYRLALLVNQLEAKELETLAVEEKVLFLFDEICARRAGFSSDRQERRVGTAARHRRLVDAARAYLDEHLNETMGLDMIAKAAGTSLYHLCRVFRVETGLTLHAYRTRQRLGCAIERLLEDGMANLSALAIELGFSSHSHLSRVFRQQVGVPPSALRMQ